MGVSVRSVNFLELLEIKQRRGLRRGKTIGKPRRKMK